MKVSGFCCMKVEWMAGQQFPAIHLERVWDLRKHEDRIIFAVTKPFRIDQTVQ
jgi:hypothetical protein